MSAPSIKLSLMTCHKYLYSDTLCNKIPPILSARKERDITLSRRLGVKSTQTVLHIIYVNTVFNPRTAGGETAKAA